MNTIVKDFERHLFEDGKSTKTIESYIGDVTGLIKYLETMGVEFDGTLKRLYITSYKNNLIENGYEPTTINKKINSFMSLNNYLIEKGYMNEVVIDLRKDQVKIASDSEHQVEVFSDRLVERILFYIQNQKKVRLRDSKVVDFIDVNKIIKEQLEESKRAINNEVKVLIKEQKKARKYNDGMQSTIIYGQGKRVELVIY